MIIFLNLLLPLNLRDNIVMKNFCRMIIPAALAAVLFSCNPRNNNILIQTRRVLITEAVPSGSGIAYYRDSVFLVGDDAEFLGVISGNDPGYRRSAFFAGGSPERIKKAVKHDLESVASGIFEGNRFLFAFGSGGISPYRDTMFAICPENGQKNFKVSLMPLYDEVMKQAGISRKELNIEGATLAGKNLLLFNRGNNFVITVPTENFYRYLRNSNVAAVPDFKISKLNLPVINNFPVGISGACTLTDELILFTASLEETKDFILDGTIKGSYIGLLRLHKDRDIELVVLTPFKDSSGKDVVDKLESIDVIRIEDKNAEVVAVADNDDGKSKLFFLRLKIPDFIQ